MVFGFDLSTSRSMLNRVLSTMMLTLVPVDGFVAATDGVEDLTVTSVYVLLGRLLPDESRLLLRPPSGTGMLDAPPDDMEMQH